MKISAVQYDWSSNSFKKNIYPLLIENNVRVCRSKVLHLKDVYSADFSASIRLQPPEISVLDFRLWFYPDEEFEKYVRHICSFSLPAVCLGESPFGFEKPNFNNSDFEEKLYKRTKTASQIIRLNSPKTKIISPAICLIDLSFQENYLDYFIHNRNCFDIYATHCIYDFKEQNAGLLTSFLNQVLSSLKKPVWVTKWAVPCCEHPIIDNRYIVPTNWNPINQVQAAQQLKMSYNAINEIAGNDTEWFFTGLDKDDYFPGKKVPTPWDGYAYQSYGNCSSWESCHFTGSICHDGTIKDVVLNSFFELVRSHI